MFHKLKSNIAQKCHQLVKNAFQSDLEDLKMLQAKALVDQLGHCKDIFHSEFKVFSQWGDDGIIQYLIRHLNLSDESFIEFGVEDYSESNTKFLLMNNNWRGLIIDGSTKYMERVRSNRIYWKYDLTAVDSFITKENINDIFKQNGFAGKLGILSIDIDGNDYWVWECIDSVDPDIVITEYNSVFGDKLAISVPYSADFVRSNHHHSGLYWGASANALLTLANQKGYALVAGNQNGNNLFFVKKELLNDRVPERQLSECYFESKFRESRDESGNLTFVSGKDRLKIIHNTEVVDVKTGSQKKIADLINEKD
ncbi:MAG: hypothetical protein MRY83_16010 [Flavobacteriales bacterium]|nr:hypothetical protein [Flavobacteriales bacterium]